MRRVDEGGLEFDGRDASAPYGLLGGEEVSMVGRGDSVRFNPASLSLTVGLTWRVGFWMPLNDLTSPVCSLTCLLACLPDEDAASCKGKIQC